MIKIAKLNFIMQGLSEENNHFDSIIRLLELNEITKVIISTAFLRKSGLLLIKNHLIPHVDKIDFYVGIRNEITSAQALQELIDLGINPFIVDTGSSDIIFHPKIYLSISNCNKNARTIIGSANLTKRGITGNIEASIVADLNLDNNFEDINILSNINNSFENLKLKFPENVVQINSSEEIAVLLSQGRISDENLKTYISKQEDLENEPEENSRETIQSYIPKIKLKLPKITSNQNNKEASIATRLSKLNNSFELTGISNHEDIIPAGCILKWESTPLKERDLNIPQGRTTNITGSMTLRSGLSKISNFQSYFRNDLFADLHWAHSSRVSSSHLEVATAAFELIILGTNHGIFHLEIKHDPRKNTASYLQNNAMSHLRWGAAAPYIKSRELLGYTLKIYENSSGSPSPFVLVIS
ncbi:phospholipase D family protein [Paenibacillus bovis]|nr:phospholipase D family protein [Paenibacillus bovis]